MHACVRGGDKLRGAGHRQHGDAALVHNIRTRVEITCDFSA